jgi:hypothetical protein
VIRIRTWVNAVILVAAASASIGTVAAVGSLSPAAASSVVQNCGMVKAGAHKYGVSATYVSCSFAKTWVIKDAAKKLKNNHESRVSIGGPSGWTCVAGSSSATGDAQVSGNCAKGSGIAPKNPYFNWSVADAFG